MKVIADGTISPKVKFGTIGSNTVTVLAKNVKGKAVATRTTVKFAEPVAKKR